MEIFDEPNPILQQENHFAGYQKSVDDLKSQPEIVEMDKLCFEIFGMTEQGKRFMELVTERYLIPSMAKRGSKDYAIDVVWAEGFKEFGRMILGSVAAHQQRIKAGTN